MQDSSVLSNATQTPCALQTYPNVPALEQAMWNNLYENIDDPIVAHSIRALSISHPELLANHTALYLGAMVSAYREERRMLRLGNMRRVIRNLLRI